MWAVGWRRWQSVDLGEEEVRASRPRAFLRGHCLPILLGLAILALAGWASAFEVDERGFPPPVLDYTFLAQPPTWIDLTDEIEGRETLVRKYLNLAEDAESYVGFSIFSIAGAVFAYLVNAKTTVRGQVTYGFMLLDSDGDGVFERKYAAAETAEVPAWVIELAFKKLKEAEPTK